MPTYDYICDACDHAFEEFQSITAKPLKKCPQCEKPKLKRLIGTGAGIIFKGSGFYETDYRSDSYKEAAKKDNEAAKPAAETKPADAKPAESAAKPKSEAKPAKKTEAKAAKPAAK